MSPNLPSQGNICDAGKRKVLDQCSQMRMSFSIRLEPNNLDTIFNVIEVEGSEID